MTEIKNHPYSGLERLPTSVLEGIIEQDCNQEADYDQELIDFVLEVLLTRAKEEDPQSIPTAQSSWNKLQQHLEGEVELGTLPTTSAPVATKKKAPRQKGFLRYAAVVAACLALVFGAMITAQAMGVNVFGELAEWTDSTFKFNLPNHRDTVGAEYSDTLVLENMPLLTGTQIPIALLPEYIPTGYEMDRVEAIHLTGMEGIHISYVHQDGRMINMTLIKHRSPKTINKFRYCKDPGEPSLYTANGIPYYVFTNNDHWCAVGVASNYTVQVNGLPSEQELRAVLDSIKE